MLSDEIIIDSTQASASTKSVGVLLINLGTPDAPSVSAVRRYLREFLMDERVIDLPSLARWFLVHGVILPFRPFQSAKAYQSIWTEQGSPLLSYGLSLCQGLNNQLPDNYQVALGMRYGNPSIKSAVQQLVNKHVEKIIVLPLFPQYASASTGSAIQQALASLAELPMIPDIHVISDFYDDPGFIGCQAQLIQQVMQQHQPEHLLLSYHGLPERQLTKHARYQCDMSQPCGVIGTANRRCYRAQCYATSQKLAQALQLKPEEYTVAFQSRLGRIPWIKPYTDEVLPVLRQQGIKKLAIACPSFVADCLETIEEIGIRGQEQWQELGGEELHLIPCVNAQPQWIGALAGMVQEK